MQPRLPTDPTIFHLDMLLDVHCGCRHIQKAALQEIELADIMKAEWARLVEDLMVSDEFEAVIQVLIDPENYYMTAGGLQYRPEAWAVYEDMAERQLGEPMARDTAAVVADSICKEYRRTQLDGSAETAPGSKKAVIKAAAAAPILGTSFNLQDTASVRNLSNNTMYWVKEGATRSVEPRIAQVVQGALEQGFGRDDTATLLREALGKQYAVNASRWDIIASSALTRARSISRMRQVTTWGVITILFTNPQDERTSAVCNSLAGRAFTTQKILSVLDTVENATTPEGAIDAQPWYSQTKDGQWKASTSTGSKEITFDDIVASGAVIPPLHGRCRSQLLPDLEERQDVSETVIDNGAVNRTEHKTAKTPATQDKRKASSVLGGLALPIPAHAEKYTAGEVATVAGISVEGAEYLRTAQTWNATEETFGLTSQWIDDASDALISTFDTAVGPGRIAVVNTSLRRVPAATWGRVADNLEGLAKDKGAAASITLDTGTIAPATAYSFRRWSLKGDGLSRFETFLSEQGYTDTLSGVDIWDVAPDAPLEEWLGLTVNGGNPLMEFFQVGGRVELELMK